MRSRLPLALSALAVVIALMGVAPVGAAVHAAKLALFARNAGAVDGLKASRTPRPGHLLALDSHGRVPIRALPAINAAAVDGFRASTNPIPGELVPLDENGFFPLETVPTPAPVGAEVIRSQDLAVGAGPLGFDVPFDQAVFDTSGSHSTTDPRLLSAPVSGYYLVTASVGWAEGPPGGAGTTRACEIEQAGSASGGLTRAQQGTTADSWLALSAVAHLARGDGVYLHCFDDATAPTAIVARGDAPTSLSIVLIMPAA
jgi:hypothetical protein